MQIFYYCLIVWIKPFELRKDNLAELINESFFVLLSGSIVYLNTENKWSSIAEKAYMYVIMANTLVISVISFGKHRSLLLVSLILHIKKNGFSCKSKENKQVRVLPVSSVVTSVVIFALTTNRCQSLIRCQ